MKLRGVIAILVVIAVAQAGLIVWLMQRVEWRVASAPPTAISSSSSPQSLRMVTNVIVAGTPSPVTNRLDWRAVESADYKRYIANLRGIGCPEETIRDIIIADVNKQFAPRYAALQAKLPKFEFWRTAYADTGGFDVASVEARQKLNQEKRMLLKELLGVEPPEDTSSMMATGFGVVMIGGELERWLEFLPPDKRRTVLEIEARYGARGMELINAAGGAVEDDPTSPLHQLARAKEAELSRLLGPEEFERYLLHMSDTAWGLRYELDGFDPTEQEFRDIFALRRETEQAIADDSSEPDMAKREAKAEAVQLERLKAQLGPERYKEYVRAQDYDYGRFMALTRKHELTKEAAIRAYDMQQAAEEQARVLRTNKTLTKEVRDAALREIRAETDRAIRGVLGDKAFEGYKQWK